MVGNDLKLGNDGDQQWRVQYYWKRINTTETNLHAWVPFFPKFTKLTDYRPAPAHTNRYFDVT